MPLTWEWGLVAGSVVCFISWVESWKAVKRRMARRRKARREAGSGGGSVVDDDKSSMA